MKNLTILIIALMFSQIISAQSLTPTTFASTATLARKSGLSLTNTTGQLTLRTTVVPTTEPVKNIVNEESAIMEVYPNPTAGFVSFNFQMAGQGKVSVSLSNSMGQKLSDLFDGSYDNGKISEQMDISTYSAGMYYLTLQYSDAAGKMHKLTKKFQVI